MKGVHENVDKSRWNPGTDHSNPKRKGAVSYTHLDVYKRQAKDPVIRNKFFFVPVA